MVFLKLFNIRNMNKKLFNYFLAIFIIVLVVSGGVHLKNKSDDSQNLSLEIVKTSQVDYAKSQVDKDTDAADKTDQYISDKVTQSVSQNVDPCETDGSMGCTLKNPMDRYSSEEFNIYENQDMGISMMIPRKFYNYTLDCEVIDGKAKMTPGMDEMKVYELDNGFVLGGTVAYNYEVENGKCKQRDFYNVENRTAFYIQEYIAKNESEINEFLQEVYGKTCKLDELVPLTQENVFSLQFSSNNGVKGPEGGCFTNWDFRNFYNQETGQIIYWDIGQDFQFLKGIDRGPYDQNISDSLMFLN